MDFNPRSLAGATQRSIQVKKRQLFQSTLPCGSDPEASAVAAAKLDISIHAPLRERLYCRMLSNTPLKFQSTLPCGSDSGPKTVELWPPSFQSTLPCGSDPQYGYGVQVNFLFQSTLPCGSDRKSQKWRAIHHDFNPRSLAGATLTLWPEDCEDMHFNPRSLAGATDKLQELRNLAQFQSTLPCGSDC